MSEDYLSDLEEDTLPVPIVDIRTGSRHSSYSASRPDSSRSVHAWSTARTKKTENDYSDDYSDEDEEYSPQDTYSAEESPQHSARSESSPHRRRESGRRQPSNLTPPDQLLQRSERKALRSWQKSQVSRTMTELIRCTALARIVHGDGSWQQARAHARLAKAYFELRGLAPQAQEHAEQAKALILRSVQVSQSAAEKADIMDSLATIFYTLGRAQASLKKFMDAEHSLQKTEKIIDERSKLPSVQKEDSSQWELNVTRALAKVYGAQKKYAAAMSCYDKLIDLLEAAHGPDSSALIPIYQEDGRLLQQRDGPGDKDAAVHNFLEAHSIACSAYGERSEEAADTALSLSRAYSALGSDDAERSAEQYVTEALAAYQSLHGPEHRKTLDVQDEQIRLMIRTDRSKEACSLIRSSLPAKRRCFGDLSSQVADSYKLLGSVLLSVSDMCAAATAFHKCYDVEVAMYGAKHRKSQETKETLDVLLKDPAVKSRLPKSKSEQLNIRPRFSGVVKTSAH